MTTSVSCARFNGWTSPAGHCFRERTRANPTGLTASPSISYLRNAEERTRHCYLHCFQCVGPQRWRFFGKRAVSKCRLPAVSRQANPSEPDGVKCKPFNYLSRNAGERTRHSYLYCFQCVAPQNCRFFGKRGVSKCRLPAVGPQLLSLSLTRFPINFATFRETGLIKPFIINNKPRKTRPKRS